MPDDLYYSMLLLLLIYVVNGICVTVCACPSGLIHGLCRVICILVCYLLYEYKDLFIDMDVRDNRSKLAIANQER